MKLIAKYHSVFLNKWKGIFMQNPIQSSSHNKTYHQQRFNFSNIQITKSTLQKIILQQEKETQILSLNQILPLKHYFQQFPVQKYEVGQRFDRYLKNTNLNWSIVQRFLRSKQIYVLTKQCKKIRQNNYRLEQGDIMFIKARIAEQMFENKQSFKEVTYEYAKQKLDEFVIFDNKNITVLNKPANFSVQGGDQIDKNLFSLMAARYKRQLVHVIHRLDKPTTGVLFFCKNLKTAQLIQAAIQSRKDYNKYYLAMSIGQKISQNEEYIRCNIEWTNKHKAKMTQSLQKQSSKDCLTYYKKLYSKELGSNKKQLNLLGLKLITGRKHQIRCHLSDYLNNPVLNDRKYGAVMLKNQENKKSIQNEQESSKQEQKYIFLHALMTTIKNNQIAMNIFLIPEDKILRSQQSQTCEVISSNQKGAILLKKGQIKIVGNLPKHWVNMTTQAHSSINNPQLKQIVMNYQWNEIKIGEQIQKSQSNLWKRHQPRKKVMTIN